MIKNIIFLFVFSFFSDFLKSQSNYHDFNADENICRFLIGDDVNIRDIPSTKGKIVSKLPIGSCVRILEKTDYTLTLKDFESHWYKVSFGDFKNKNIGYIWGGMISYMTAVASNDSEKGYSYHFGVHSVDHKHEFGNSGTFQIRVSKDNKQLDKILTQENISFIDSDWSFNSIGNKGLKNIDDILSVSIFEEKCDGANHGMIYLVSDGKLHFLSDVGGSGYSDEWEETYIIYPDDERGSPNTIIVVYEYYYMGKRDISFTKYRWNGSSLIEI